jgi:hypothetical protein
MSGGHWVRSDKTEIHSIHRARDISGTKKFGFDLLATGIKMVEYVIGINF